MKFVNSDKVMLLLMKYASRSSKITHSDICEWYEGGADVEEFMRILKLLFNEGVVKTQVTCSDCYLRGMVEACYRF